MLKILINIFFVLSLLCSSMIHAQNVNPSVSDPAELERIESEREQIFATLIEDPTNMDNLFKYANLSILIGDLEAAVGVFEQMLIYDDSITRIRRELGVVDYRLGACTNEKVDHEDVERDKPTEEGLNNEYGY